MVVMFILNSALITIHEILYSYNRDSTVSSLLIQAYHTTTVSHVEIKQRQNYHLLILIPAITYWEVC